MQAQNRYLTQLSIYVQSIDCEVCSVCIYEQMTVDMVENKILHIEIVLNTEFWSGSRRRPKLKKSVEKSIETEETEKKSR